MRLLPLYKNAPVPAMAGYAEALVPFALAYLGALLKVMPNVESALQRVEELRAALLAQEGALSEAIRLHREAGTRFAQAEEGARALYGDVRGRALLVLTGVEGGDAIGDMLKGCPAHSSLDADALPLAMEALGRGVLAYPALFAEVSADAATAAALADGAQALRKGVADRTKEAAAEDKALHARDQAREALFAQIRVIERGVKLALRGGELDEWKALRNGYLPRPAPRSPASADVA